MATTKTTTTKKTTTKSEPMKTSTKPALKKISEDEEIDVRSCVVGKLSWIGATSGDRIQWSEFGDINPMTVGQLREMRNSAKRFFENNWVMLEGERAGIILEYLGLSKYYKDIVHLDDIDSIFKEEPEEIAGIVGKYSPSMKELIARRAASLVSEGEIDSVKTIEAIQKATGFVIEA